MLILINEARPSSCQSSLLPLCCKHIYVFMHVFVSRVSAHVSSFMSLVPEAAAEAGFAAASAVVLVVSFMTLFHIPN